MRKKIKNTLGDIAAGIYGLGCGIMGVVAGKFIYDVLSNTELSTPEKAGLAVVVGMTTTIVLGIPSFRYKNPRCPECDSGRLKIKSEVIKEYKFPSNTKLYYGFRGVQHFIDVRTTSNCDRCDYNGEEIITKKGKISIG